MEIKGNGLEPKSRILGVVYKDGQDVNLEMLRTGLTEVYRGPHQLGFSLDEYKQTKWAARRSGRGIWAPGEDYTSPRDWRNIQRRQRDVSAREFLSGGWRK